LVRARSTLDGAELQRRLLERRPRVLDVPGLLQKVCGRDPPAGRSAGSAVRAPRSTGRLPRRRARQDDLDGLRGRRVPARGLRAALPAAAGAGALRRL